MTVRSEGISPLVLLAAYGITFGAVALGRAPLAFDDHPGQLYRVWHVVARGPAPWTWNPDWWAGYPELQFYPPGFAYAGALLHWASFTALSVPAAFHALVWIAYLAPGLTAFLALARILGSGWLALPGAFVALTLSAGTTSGVEGGVHIGMVGARLAWALVPLLLYTLVPWIEDARRPSWSAPILIGAILLLHPAELPAAVALIALAALARSPRARRLAVAAVVLAVAAALTAFWTVPLVVRLAETRALAWGGPPRVGLFGGVLGLLALLGLLRAWSGGRAVRVLAAFPWVMVIVTLLDRYALEPLGARWLPANRVVDGAWLALVLAAGLGWSGRRRANGHEPLVASTAVTEPHWSFRFREPLIGLAGVLLLIAVSLRAGAGTLTLWPRPAEWPSLATVERGLRLGDLWTTLRDAPEGRILFLRSGVPLTYGSGAREWYRPHTHVTALTPVYTGRAIVHGTFTHPSPIAALVYRGDAGRAPITHLAEQLDGRSIFGRPLETLDPAAIDDHADRLGVSVVVALDEDAPGLRGLDESVVFAKRAAPEPFVVYVRRAPVALPRPGPSGRWAVTVTAADRDAWVSTRTTYYPLWRAGVDGATIESRRGRFGDLEVRSNGSAATVELAYVAGAPEIASTIVSAVIAAAWLAAGAFRLYTWGGSKGPPRAAQTSGS